jgi:hypothetical protein
VLLQGHELFRLGARYWLGAPNDWDTTCCPQVLGRSVGEPVHPIFIGSTGRSNLHPQIHIEIRMGRRIVPISFPQPTIIGLLKMKKVIIIFNSIKIITYEIKWLNNIPQSVEHGCQRTVAPPFGSLDFARASQQIAPLGSAHVQEM